MRCKCIRRRTHHAQHGVLGRGVGEHRGAAVTAFTGQTLRRTDQNDGPASALADDGRHRGEDRVPHALEVGVDDRVEHRFGAGGRVTDRHHSGVGDDDVDIAERVDPGLHCGFQLRQIANIGDSRCSPASGGLDQPYGLVEIGLGAQRVRNSVDIRADVDGDDVGTLLGERDGVATTLPPGGAGHYGDGVIEFTHGYTANLVPVSFSANATKRAATS